MQKGYRSGNMFRYFFIITAALIAIVSVWATNGLVNKLKEEEHKKINIWAESIVLQFTSLEFEGLQKEEAKAFSDYRAHLQKIIDENTTIPVILTDDSGEIVDNKNISVPEQNADSYLKNLLKKFAKKNDRITIPFDENINLYVYYDDSIVLKRLRVFPIIQLTVVLIFIVISFLALTSAQRAEQNRVWVGLSKETAHQLGTPISSLMAWVEYFKTKKIDPKLLNEMDKDVQRLKTIAERFSKIGSSGEPENMDLALAIGNAVEYMSKRISTKVNIFKDLPDEPVTILMNESLFGWTLENLIKNAVDAMDGQGDIKIHAFRKGKKVIMDISDTGKGISKSRFNTIFQPGYTTKKRGWGLGLSLVKRIIESYQKGKIYVYKSELGKGTTIRIELKAEG
jgi:signal transduction histidine kinase